MREKETTRWLKRRKKQKGRNTKYAE
jgi:hypothetical protein